MERPAAEDRMAVFEIRLLPGRESMMDWALALGSSAGKLEALRTAVSAGLMRWAATREGRRRAAPDAQQSSG